MTGSAIGVLFALLIMVIIIAVIAAAVAFIVKFAYLIIPMWFIGSIVGKVTNKKPSRRSRKK